MEPEYQPELRQVIDRYIFQTRTDRVGYDKALVEMKAYWSAFPILGGQPGVTPIALYQKELAHFLKRKAVLETQLTEEREYHAAHPDEYYMPLDDVAHYALWLRQLATTNEAITICKREIRRLYAQDD